MNYSIANSSGTSSVAPVVGHFLLIFPAPHGGHGHGHSLQAIKTNPHLYPEVGGGGVRVYFDWCIITLAIVPLCRTAAGQRAFTFRGQKLWNSLPDEFQSITNLHLFKVKIKHHFLRVFLEN